MIFHIVKQDETLKDLIFKYGLDKSEIISKNRHISDWDTLIPGVKLKIPIVNNNLYEHLEEVEPFIEDYYPNDTYDINDPDSDTKTTQTIKEDVKEEKESNNISVNYVPDETDQPEISEYKDKITKETQSQYKVKYQDKQKQDNEEQIDQSTYPDNDQAQYDHSQYQQNDQEQYDYTQYQQNDQEQYDYTQYQQNDQEQYDYTQYQDNNQEQYNQEQYQEDDQVQYNQQYQGQVPNQGYQTNQQNVNPNYYQQPNNGLLQNLNNQQVNQYMQPNNSMNPAYYYQLAMANQYRNMNQNYRILYYDPIRKQYFYL